MGTKNGKSKQTKYHNFRINRKIVKTVTKSMASNNKYIYMCVCHLHTCNVYIPRLAFQDKVTLRLLKLYSRMLIKGARHKLKRLELQCIQISMRENKTFELIYTITDVFGENGFLRGISHWRLSCGTVALMVLGQFFWYLRRSETLLKDHKGYGSAANWRRCLRCETYQR